MPQFDPHRRTLLASAAGLALSPILKQNFRARQTQIGPGFVLAPGEGERFVHFRDGGNIVIKIGSATGSPDLAVGIQQVLKGTGIPVHRHERMDEAFSVLDGGGSVLLNDVRYPFEKGCTIFIPRSTWHGFENPDHELLLQWTVSPSGLDDFFRETCSAPGAAPKGLTKDQIRKIARKHDTEFR